ncbi:MAG: 2-dehydropantoate 2-reductase [Hyphomicrobiales bacterium]|jgi:2-dehydropantoate 2-reductase|nr:2-dehydropantoate 2-reductase [Hyphomicrobiales bacterium]MBV9910268.1 2-dehydropantoate 2-reductase [Hyphomicrobiales bacterium]
MRIAIMGSGGIGGYLGARLVQGSEDVVFIARGAHLEAMRRSGLRLQSQLGDIALGPVRATEAPKEIGAVDLVIFAVKLYDTEVAAAAVVPLVGPATRVVTLQNGIDSVETLARFMPRSQVVGGATYMSARLEEPGLIVHAGKITRVVVGSPNDAMIEMWRSACLKAGGIDLETVEDIEQVLWNKFVTVSAFSGATSLMRAGVGPILNDPQSRMFLEQLRDEGVAVASAAGHSMPDEDRERIMSYWGTFPPETRSSMANDLAQGRPLELSWLSGRMHTLGEKFGVPTPAHSAVYRALHLYADGAKPSGQALP